MNSKGKPALTFKWLKNYSENSMNSTILGILIATHITFQVDKKILKILRILQFYEFQSF